LEIFNNEKNYLELLFKKEIPSNYLEFRYSPYYVLPSHLKKYQALKPDAKPIGIKFKDEDIYERSNIVELHTKSRWLRMMRKIKPGYYKN
jgi:xeroderma pigmentosum group C-complementing protein